MAENDNLPFDNTEYYPTLRARIKAYSRMIALRGGVPLADRRSSAFDALVRLVQPWDTRERYPGYAEILARSCGVARKTVYNWGQKTDLPLAALVKLSAYCRDRAGRYLSIAEEMDHQARLKREALRGLAGMFEVGYWDGPDMPPRNRTSNALRRSRHVAKDDDTGIGVGAGGA